MKIQVTFSTDESFVDQIAELDPKDGSFIIGENTFSIFEYSFYGELVTVRTNEKLIFRGFIP